MYCPACRGHGTNVHECKELLSVVVDAKDLEELLNEYGEIMYEHGNGNSIGAVERLREALYKAQGV